MERKGARVSIAILVFVYVSGASGAFTWSVQCYPKDDISAHVFSALVWPYLFVAKLINWCMRRMDRP